MKKNKKTLYHIHEKNSGRPFIVIARDSELAITLFYNNCYEYFDNNRSFDIDVNES